MTVAYVVNGLYINPCSRKSRWGYSKMAKINHRLNLRMKMLE